MRKPDPKLKTFVLGVRVDAETKAAIEAAAKADNRPVSQWLSLKIKDALKGETDV